MAEKFADLPDVVTDQPDTFETEDTELEEGPVASTSDKPEKSKAPSENVETAPLNLEEASARFKGKTVGVTGADFSDSIVTRPGYMALSEYGTRGEGEKETPQQKMLRLQTEIKEFQEELSLIQEASVADAQEDNIAPMELAAQVKSMLGDLQQVNLERLLGSVGPDGLPPTLHADITKRLLGEISKAKQAGAAAADGDKKAPGDNVTYELYYRPEHTKFAQVAKAGALEARLQKLEAKLGAESLAPLAVELNINDLTVQGATAALGERVAALSEMNLSDLDRRLTTVLQNLEVAKKKQASAEPSQYAEKVNELYEITKRWDGVAGAVPAVIERLTALKTMHEHGAEFDQTLTHLETVQNQLKDHVSSQGATLKVLEESMAKNMATIAGNVTDIEKRIEALTQKLAKLG